MIKKALIILFCILFCAFPLVSCGNVQEKYEMIINSELLYGRDILSTMPNSKALIYAYDNIVVGVNKSLKEIPVSDSTHHISKDELEVVVDIYTRDHIEHFWFGNAYEYSFNDQTVVSLKPNYIMSGSSLEKAKHKLEERVVKLLEGITSSLSEYEKELLIHDILAQNTVYKEAKNAHNLYGAIVEGKAVCEGYTEALQYLLNRAGISSFKISGYSKNPSGSSSESESHAWNLVRIDGEFYHVDLTWNDQENQIYHAYFNVTDTVILRDHQITPTTYQLPTCNLEDANYFIKSGTRVKNYTVDSIVALFDKSKTVSFYIDGDKEAFLSWYKNNITSIAKKLGIKGSFEYSSKSLGNEIVLTIITE